MTIDTNAVSGHLNARQTGHKAAFTALKAAIGLGQTLMESFRMPHLPLSEIVEIHVRYHQNP
jgi:hypothetical protein